MAARRRLRVPPGRDAEGGAQGARRRARAADPRLRRRRRRLPGPARRRAARRGVAARGHRPRGQPRRRRRAAGRRRRLPPAPLHPHRAARPHARRRARRPAALRRHAAARADGQRAGRDLPLRLARRLQARADQRRDRAHLRLPAGELHRQRQAHADEHRPPRRPASGSSRRSSTPTTTTAPFVLEYRIVRADGEIRWVLDRGQLVQGPGGRLWMDGAIFDITERREAEDALRRREVEAARTEELQRLARPHRRGRRRRPAQDRARPPRRRAAAAGQRSRSTCASRARGSTKDPDSAGPFLDRLGEELAQASAELRELARGIHPAVLTERGLAPAIETLASRAPVPVEVVALPEERLPPVVEATAYFTVSEALTNVAKYANASHATVRLANGDDALVVEVQDDGVGGAQRRRRLGAERARRPRRRRRRLAERAPARPARARWCARCCRFSRLTYQPPRIRSLGGSPTPRRIGCCDHARRWRPSSASRPRRSPPPPDRQRLPMTARGKRWKPGSRRTRTPIRRSRSRRRRPPRSSRTRARSSTASCSKGGEQTFGGATFDPPSGVLQGVRDQP